MGDHGAWVPPKNIKGIVNAKNGTQEIIRPALTALATPFFAVKPADDTGPIIFSDAPSAITDTSNTIAALLDLENNFNGTSVFELSSTAIRERRFMFYQYRRSEWTDDYLAPIEQFLISGNSTIALHGP